MRRAAIAALMLGLLLCAAVQAQDAADSAAESAEEPVEAKKPTDSDPEPAQKAAEAAPAEASPEAAADAPKPAPRPTPPPPKKASSLGVKDLAVAVFSPEGKKQSSKSGALGDTLLPAVKLAAQQYVEVSFVPLLDGEASKPQQAMLMAESKAHPGLAAYVVAKAKKGGSHVATLSTTAIEKQLGSVGGELEVSLLLGDPAAPKGVSGRLGSVLLPESAEGVAPKPKLLTAASQPINNLKPNIAHTFRVPEKRPPAVVSLAFTAIAFAPLALLVVMLGLLGVNVRGLPTGGASLWVLLFHGGIAAMLGLYLLFWLRLNLAQTLPLAGALGLFIAATGYKALGALSEARLAEAKAGGAAVVAAKKTN